MATTDTLRLHGFWFCLEQPFSDRTGEGGDTWHVPIDDHPEDVVTAVQEAIEVHGECDSRFARWGMIVDALRGDLPNGGDLESVSLRTGHGARAEEDDSWEVFETEDQAREFIRSIRHPKAPKMRRDGRG